MLLLSFLISPALIAQDGFGSHTIGDTNYHTLYIDRSASYFGDVKFDTSNRTTSQGPRAFEGRDYKSDANVTASVVSDLWNDWTFRDDGTIIGDTDVDLSSARPDNALEAPLTGIVSDTYQTPLLTGVLNDTTQKSSFDKGQYLISARYGSNASDSITDGDSRFIGAAINADSFGGQTRAGVGLGTLDIGRSGDSITQIVKAANPNSDAPDSFSSRLELKTSDTGAITVQKPSDPTLEMWDGAVTDDNEFLFAHFSPDTQTIGGKTRFKNASLRPVFGVRVPEGGYNLSDFFGFYSVNKFRLEFGSDTGLYANQSYVEAGFDTQGQGEFSAFDSIQDTKANIEGSFSVKSDSFPRSDSTTTITEAKNQDLFDSYIRLKDNKGSTFRAYLSPSSKYFVAVPEELGLNQFFVGVRMPNATVSELATDSSDSIASSSDISGTVANKTDKTMQLSMGPLGSSHPRNNNFSQFKSESLKDDNSIADTAFGSGVDVTPDTSVNSDSFVTCLNLNDNPDTASFSDSQFVPLIYETDKGWEKVTDAGGTITSRNGARVCFKPPHFSNMALTASSTEGGGGSNGSDDDSCIIERSGVSDSGLQSLRNARDWMMSTSLGRWITQNYYSVQ